MPAINKMAGIFFIRIHLQYQVIQVGSAFFNTV